MTLNTNQTEFSEKNVLNYQYMLCLAHEKTSDIKVKLFEKM